MEQVPPDGDDVSMEWKEGRQRVVERKSGAGDDVRFFFSLLVFFCSFWFLRFLNLFLSVLLFLSLYVGGLVFISPPSCGVFLLLILASFSFFPLYIPFTLIFAPSSPPLLLFGPDTDPISPYRSNSRSWMTAQTPPRQGAKPPFCTISTTALARF